MIFRFALLGTFLLTVSSVAEAQLPCVKRTLSMAALPTPAAPGVLKIIDMQERVDEGQDVRRTDRLYLMLCIPDLLPDVLTGATVSVKIDERIALDPEVYEIEELGSGHKFKPSFVYVLGGGLALFGNYGKHNKYRVTLLQKIPIVDIATRASAGNLPDGVVTLPNGQPAEVTWTLEGHSGLRGRRTLEFTPSLMSNTLAAGDSSAFSFDLNAAWEGQLGKKRQFYLDAGTEVNASTESVLSFNSTAAHLNFGGRYRRGKIKFEMTNEVQGNQKFEQIDYAVGAKARFLPPLAISWFSSRFAWDPLMSVGYLWAREIDRGANDTTDSTHRLTYDLYWVVPIGERFAISLEGSGIVELIQPVTAQRFHDKTVAGFHILMYEKDQVKVETAFQYKRGEAPPSFTFNQSILLGLFLKIR